MDFWDCQAYFYTSLRNVTADDQDDYIESRTRYLEGPCLNPLSLQVGETESLHHGTQLDLGDNDMTWTFDHLTTGVEYRLEWYWNKARNRPAGPTTTSPTMARMN